MVNNNITHKNTALKLSDQVQELLKELGFSFTFNWNDYARYKKQYANAFNNAYTIAEQFVLNAEEPGDFNDYIF